MVPSLDLASLRPTYYTANCHKWLCTPKGSAFLYVDPAHHARFRPLVLSNNAQRPIAGRDQFLTEFDYLGTTDQTAFMSIPASLRVMRDIACEFLALPGTTTIHDAWAAIMAYNHSLAIQGRNILCNALRVQPPAPDSMIGSIATIILPDQPPDLMARLRQRPTRYHDALQDSLLDRHHIQVPVWSVPDRPLRTLRISAQLYNSLTQYEYLANALLEELAREQD
jgi:isopenicillin-N epimerase